MAFNTDTGQSVPLTVIGSARSDGAITIEVVGDIDISTSPRLLAEIRALLAGGPSSVVLDLTRVGFCDSSGLSVLVQLNRQCAEAETDLALAPSKVVRRAIELTGLLSTLKFVE